MNDDKRQQSVYNISWELVMVTMVSVLLVWPEYRLVSRVFVWTLTTCATTYLKNLSTDNPPPLQSVCSRWHSSFCVGEPPPLHIRCFKTNLSRTEVEPKAETFPSFGSMAAPSVQGHTDLGSAPSDPAARLFSSEWQERDDLTQAPAHRRAPRRRLRTLSRFNNPHELTPAVWRLSVDAGAELAVGCVFSVFMIEKVNESGTIL